MNWDSWWTLAVAVLTPVFWLWVENRWQKHRARKSKNGASNG